MIIHPIRDYADIDRNGVRYDSHYEMWLPADAESWRKLAALPRRYFPAKYAMADIEPKDWNGNVTYQQAVDLYVHGWPEGLEHAERIIKRLTVNTHAQQRKLLYRPAVAPSGGLQFNIGAIAQGRPDQFIRSVQSAQLRAGKRIFRLAVNASVSAAVDQSLITARGAVVMALVKLLERSNRAVSVDVVMAVNSYGKIDLCLHRVKQAGDDPNDAKLIFSLAHSASLRRMLLTAYEHLPDDRGGQPNHGLPYPVRSILQGRYDLIIDSETAYENELWKNPARQEHWIKEQLRQQGIQCK